MELLRFGTMEAEQNMKIWESDFRDNTDIPEDAYLRYLAKCKKLFAILTPIVDKGSTKDMIPVAGQDVEDLLNEIKEELDDFIHRENVEILLQKIHTYIHGVMMAVFSVDTKEQVNKTNNKLNAEEQKMNVNPETRIKELEEQLAKKETEVQTVVKEVSVFDRIPGGIYTAGAIGIVAAYGIYKVGYLKGYATGKDESATIIIMDERE